MDAGAPRELKALREQNARLKPLPAEVNSKWMKLSNWGSL
jgi:hypothetical protein